VFGHELARVLAGERRTLGRLQVFGKHDRGGDAEGFALRGSGAVPPVLRSAHFAALLLWVGLRERPGLIVSTHVNFGPVARWLRVLTGTPYVLVAHGIDVHPGLSRRARLALREADAVWAVSRWTRQRLVALGVAASRIKIVPNTVAADRFQPGPADAGLRAHYGLAPGERVVLTVARLDAVEGYKGYDLVLRALPLVCQAMGPVRYLVVGSGSDAPRLQALAATLGVADRLTLCGFVPDDELAAHYRLADVFAMPSKGEGFGIVFLEAMACGIPVLSGDQDGSVDALGEGTLGLSVDPDDADAVATGLIALLRRQGPACWFDPNALRAACLRRFGRDRFAQIVTQRLGRGVKS
jgi:glycosyltransferase involved in cell wall biosynthesis